MGDLLPRKLTHDAIAEAVLDIRFDARDNQMPEILLGRLADFTAWRGFKHSRLPTADIPGPIRRSDPNLRYQPSFELTSPDGRVIVKIGPSVLAFIRRAPYPGWDSFSLELKSVVEHLFSVLLNTRTRRIGLRYVNLLRSDVHSISSAADLDIAISAGGRKIGESFNLNFGTKLGKDLIAMTRIATVDFAEGSIPREASMVVDVDVYNSDSLYENVESLWDWIERAHDFEKSQFFGVLGNEVTQRLSEKP